MATAVWYAFDYLASIPVFGIVYYMLNIILVDMSGISMRGDVYDLANYVWVAAIVIHIILGAFWFLNKIKENQNVYSLI